MMLSVADFEDITANTPQLYIHSQLTPSSHWMVDHNLNTYPTVVCTTVHGEQFIADITYLSTNQLTITANIPITGYAYCK